jgi:hypothetical protein
MKRKYKVNMHDRVVEREYSYIPIRYIIAFALTLLEVTAIIAIVALLCYYVPYEITEDMLHVSMPVRLLRSIVRIFAPLL